jgi:phage shock protein PspC (stress-responsive transcriptional regulator)
MKKVININFHGRVVPIEETAYDVLKQYVDSLRRFFANEEGRDEIINDIEDRIAELFAETLKKGSTCISDADVNTIIASMGRPEEFEAEESNVKSQLGGDSQGSYSGYQSAEATPRGRLYRDDADKILGGVCGGIGNYLRIDTSLVRILFAIITLGGFGAGILLYVLMWIILPSRSLERNVIRKRLFRNPEDKVVGGVASGLSAYFNMAVWIPRVIFAFPLVLGILTSIMRNAFWHFDPFPSIIFGSFGGTLFVVYAVLWAVIPEAKSASEKLEMKGEKVDLNTIKNTIQEDLKGFGARAEKWGKEVGEKAGQWGKEVGETTGQTAADFTTVTKKRGNRLLSVLAVLIKAVLLFIAGILAFLLLTAIIVGSIKGFDFIPLKDYLLEGDMQNFLVWPAIFLFIFLPVIGLVTWVVRRIMKVKSGKHNLGWIFGGLWTIGLLCAIGLGTGIGSNFSRQVSEKFPANLAQPTNDMLVVRLGTEPGKYYPYTVFDDDHDSEMMMLTKDEDSMLLKRVTIEVAKSDDTLYHAYIIKFSRGQSLNKAEENMQKVSFNISQMDSVLTMQKGFAISKNDKFRDQRVALVIEVPVGKRIFLDENLDWFDWFNLDFDRGRYSRNTAYDKRTYAIYTGRSYTMTTSGLERTDKDEERKEYGDDNQPEQKSKEQIEQELKQHKDEIERLNKQLNKDSTYKYKPATRTGATEAGEDATGATEPQAKKDNKAVSHVIIGDIMMMRFGS